MTIFVSHNYDIFLYMYIVVHSVLLWIVLKKVSDIVM